MGHQTSVYDRETWFPLHWLDLQFFVMTSLMTILFPVVGNKIVDILLRSIIYRCPLLSAFVLSYLWGLSMTNLVRQGIIGLACGYLLMMLRIWLIQRQSDPLS